MALNTPVKWYDNSMGGITRGNSAANMVAFLDAVLVDGFNTITVDSLVVSGNVATCTRSAGSHGFVPYQVIQIAGASPSALNGQWRVVSVTSTTWTFAVTGVSDQTASGTITCKTPGLGWERPFPGSGNTRVYRSPNVDHCARSYFRFSNVGGSYGMTFQPYEAMTDLNTGTGNWNHPSQASFTVMSFASQTNWFCVGDDKTFYVAWNCYWPGNIVTTFCFGAFESYKPNDVHNDFYMDLQQNSSIANASCGYGPFNTNIYSSSGSDYNCGIRRRSIGDVMCRCIPTRWVNDSSGYGGPNYPEPFTNGLFVTPNLLRDVDYGGNPVRGRIRGTYWVLQNAPMYCPIPGVDLDNIVGLEGRRCRMLTSYWGNGSTVYETRALYDITGPWS